MNKLLEVKGLKIGFDTTMGLLTAVDNVSFSLNEGETLCIVGESGSGKSVTSLGIMRLLQSPPAHYLGGEILYNGENLLIKTEAEMRDIRGSKISMIFQEP
ncbi:MAG TPA: peptide ABC transporter ATP-binding protein, partial [Clostridiales bacterium]|nr:peptide ABC transporter ATP-binding protein [Clostridiales bacterium]